MFKIISKKILSFNIKSFEINAPDIAKNAKADIVPVAIAEFTGYPKLKPFTRRKGNPAGSNTGLSAKNIHFR